MKDKNVTVQQTQPEIVRTKKVPAKDFFKGVWIELSQRVKWPTRKELMNYTVVVLSFVIFWALYVGIWDFIFAKGVELITR